MSIKIALLKSGESVIADIKELVQEDQLRGYIVQETFYVNLITFIWISSERIWEG